MKVKEFIEALLRPDCGGPSDLYDLQAVMDMPIQFNTAGDSDAFVLSVYHDNGMIQVDIGDE